MYAENVTNNTAEKVEASIEERRALRRRKIVYCVGAVAVVSGTVILAVLTRRMYHAKQAEAFDAGFFVGQHWK